MILKMIAKIALIPVWIVLCLAWLLVKILVGIYSFARGFLGLGLAVLIVATVICYHDWVQVMVLAGIGGVLMAVLVAGVTVEVLLEGARRCVGKWIII